MTEEIQLDRGPATISYPFWGAGMLPGGVKDRQCIDHLPRPMSHFQSPSAGGE